MKAAPASALVRTLTLVVNGRARQVTAAPDTSLLTILRNDLGLSAPKYGCGLGQCGACTIHVDGIAARACVIPVGGIVGRDITTLEGLGDAASPHPVQQAFIDEQAAQCGYCLNGMIMTAAAFLAAWSEPGEPDEAAIRQALAGNLCRCGTHVEILRAVHRAAGLLRVQAAASTARAAESIHAAQTAKAASSGAASAQTIPGEHHQQPVA